VSEASKAFLAFYADLKVHPQNPISKTNVKASLQAIPRHQELSIHQLDGSYRLAEGLAADLVLGAGGST
jgi:hypothetical protein